MLQKKRDEFRKEIRKKQLDKIRQQKRKVILELILNQDFFVQIDHIWTHIESDLNFIAQKNYSLLLHSATNQIYRKGPIIQHNQDQQNFHNFINHMNKLKSISPHENQKVLTQYMMKKQSAEKVIKILNDLIQNQWDIDEQGNQNLQNIKVQKFSSFFRLKVIKQIIKYVESLQLTVLHIDVTKIIIDSIWELITETDEILFTQKDNYECFEIALKILTKLLQQNKNALNYEYMLQKGLGSQIVRFISKIKKSFLSLQIHSAILHLVDNYINFQITTPKKKQPSQKIGQITIQSQSVNQKENLFFYCVGIIDKSQESLYPIVFSCMSKLLEIYSFLVDSLKQEYWQKVCNLIFHPNRQIQVQALFLLNDFTFHSQTVLDFLLEKSQLFDLLYKRLMIEKSSSDSFANSCIQKIAYIICNSLLSPNLKIKKSCLKHYIWEQIFNSLHPSLKLFPLIMTMPYFFTAKGHKNFDKFLKPYLETIKNFQWENCKYSDAIKDSILQTFYAAQYWQQTQYIRFLNLLQQQGFLFLVEHLIQQDDMERIKDQEIN